MADPLSFLAAGVSISDVAYRIIRYLKDVQAAVKTIDEGIGELISEVQALVTLHGHLEQEFRKNVTNEALDDHEKMMWFNTGLTLKNGQRLAQKLDLSIRYIYGDHRKVIGKRDGLHKQHRKWAKGGIIAGFRDQIGTYHGALQLWVSCISMYSAREDHKNQTLQLEKLSGFVKELESKIEGTRDIELPTYETVAVAGAYKEFTAVSLNVMKQIGTSINSIENSLTQTRHIGNEHFDIPKSINRFYTGRTHEADQLHDWLLPESTQSLHKISDKAQLKQKRFVIYGVGGSGKTEFCCKFAEDNRDHFWGVFWVNGSSHMHLKRTFSTNVSAIGKVEANVNAALHWLSNRTEPWLLIIDNADDPDLKLDEYLPKVGSKYFEFQGLKYEEANHLLLTAAGQSKPWDSVIVGLAAKITKALGYLALFVTHAGTTIREGFCKLHEYLGYYERQWKKTRLKRQAVKTKDEFDDLQTFATFELSRKAITARGTQASRDALQLLDTFAFLHNRDIPFEILKSAVINFQIEKKYQQTERQKEKQKQGVGPKPDWATWFREGLFAILAFIYTNRSPPVLPYAIRAGQESSEFDPDRLRAALRELTLFSLITHIEKTDSYLVHLLVHKWVRERPGMSILEQSVWSEAAAQLLACCILIPPLGNTTEDENMRKLLLPHIIHVQECQKSIEQRMKDNRMSRMKPWPVFDGSFNKERALMYAKFSMVYSQNGVWDEAKRLQSVVKDFTMKVLGIQHATTRRVTLALSRTMYLLGQSDDAATLQKQVLDACTVYKGANDLETLVAKSVLGESRFMQGRLSDAKQLLEEAVADLTRYHGPDHEETLNAIDKLGLSLVMFHTKESMDRARDLHLTAAEGMKRVHGHDHLRTLEAIEHLCLDAVHSHNYLHLEEAHEMMLEILETRRRKLGREHAYTLLAMVNLAQIKRELGGLKDAEELIQLALLVGKRNLGDGHIAYLWARYLLGQIWVRQERWEEAEQLFVDVTHRQQSLLHGRGRYHPDRLGGLVELTTVYNALGNEEERDKIADEALDGFDKISRTEHPLARRLREDKERWNKNKKSKSSGT